MAIKSKYIPVRFPEDEEDKMNQLVEEGRYDSKSSLIRKAVEQLIVREMRLKKR